MSFVQPQRNPLRLSVGIGVAIVFHIALVWALINGLAHKVMQAISAPIETRLIEEVKPPPPPPKPVELELPPPPKFAPPPPAYVPPPEVQVPNPPPAETIATTTAAPPPPAPVAPRVEAPKPPPPPTPAPAPVAPPPPAPISAGVACSNFTRVMGEAAFPRAAQRMGLDSGEALIQFTLGAGGEIKDVKAISASDRVFAENSIRIVKEFTCAGRGVDVTVRVPFTYKSE